eukprot:m.90027 g.90027  ORF g.90027 m.90027 type:complete len:225 (+) comp26358_c0_seq1:595-1269(+)
MMLSTSNMSKRFSNEHISPPTTLVVDRDSARGIALAFQIIASDENAPEFRSVTIISRACSLEACNCGNYFGVDPSAIRFISANSDELNLAEMGPATWATLILDNVSGDTHEEIAKYEKLFDQVIIVSAYPTYKPDVRTIVASPSTNTFLWASLFEAYMSSTATESFFQQYQQTVRQLGKQDLLFIDSKESKDCAVTWQLSPSRTKLHPRQSIAACATIPTPIFT